MRTAFPRHPACRIAPLLLALGLSAAAIAAPAPIDPDPASPTLGDLLDRERRQTARRAEPPAGTSLLRSTTADARVPADATTVLVPGGRSRPVRVIPIHRTP